MPLSEQDKIARAEGMGGTDIADVIEGRGFQVYRRKVEGYELPDSAPLRRGRIFEAPSIQLYEIETGAVIKPGGLVRHPTNKIVLGNVDGFAHRDRTDRVLEIKTVGWRNARLWGESGNPDGVPERAIMQGQWYLGITGLQLLDVAALVGMDDLRIYTVHFEPDMFANMVEIAQKFWRDHVIPKRPPPPDGTEACTEWTKVKWPVNKANVLKADPTIEIVAKRLQRVKDELSRLSEEEECAKNELKQVIGDADGMVGSDWRISWKSIKSKLVTDWEAVAREAGAANHLIERHTSAKPGPRVFRTTFSGSKDE